MATCKDGCKHSVFCHTWGEHKCLKKKRHIRSGEITDCELYEKGNNTVPVCHCETCESRYMEDDD